MNSENLSPLQHTIELEMCKGVPPSPELEKTIEDLASILNDPDAFRDDRVPSTAHFVCELSRDAQDLVLDGAVLNVDAAGAVVTILADLRKLINESALADDPRVAGPATNVKERESEIRELLELGRIELTVPS